VVKIRIRLINPHRHVKKICIFTSAQELPASDIILNDDKSHPAVRKNPR
jgi:hypothetical protein